MLWESTAVAKAAMETGVARKTIDIDEYRLQLAFRQGKGARVRYFILNKAQSAKPKKRIAFGEGEETKIIRAAAQVQEEGIGIPILIGRPEVIQKKIKEMALDLDCAIVDPNNSERFEAYVKAFHELRARKGMILPKAYKRVSEPNVFGPMMVKMGDADAYVSGLTYEYPEVIKPALQIHRTREGARLVTGVYIMIVEDRVILFTDATVNIEPTPEDLAEIAVRAASFAKALELEPRIAFLSFSNFGSTDHPLTVKVRKAVELVRKNRPDLVVDGEMQADTAVVPDIIEQRYPFSTVKDANVLVFPSLESANIAYKLLARLGNAKAIGPILLGTGAPIQVLQTGDEVDSIVQMAAMAAMDAMSRD
jgi:malate dehydrogenase (oxaloacetate-decarboxylating)(NADP+)